MTISAKIIADSCQYGGKYRLTTFVLRYPRYIHSELMTHRVFSRNASSSRAIPVQKLIDSVMQDPVIPISWGKNQPGMQAKDELSETEAELAKQKWLEARDRAVESAKDLLKLGLHKQIVNRVLEPFLHIEVIVTATDWANFYALRSHPDAQPEIQKLAQTMLAAHKASIPKVLNPGEWHLPFITEDDVKILFPTLKDGQSPAPYDWLLPKISAARCARVSYLKHDGQVPTVEEDRALYDRLVGGEIKHASPTEHQAHVPKEIITEFDEPPNSDDDYVWDGPFMCYIKPERRSNLTGWIQFRKLIPGEKIVKYGGFNEL